MEEEDLPVGSLGSGEEGGETADVTLPQAV